MTTIRIARSLHEWRSNCFTHEMHFRFFNGTECHTAPIKLWQFKPDKTITIYTIPFGEERSTWGTGTWSATFHTSLTVHIKPDAEEDNTQTMFFMILDNTDCYQNALCSGPPFMLMPWVEEGSDARPDHTADGLSSINERLLICKTEATFNNSDEQNNPFIFVVRVTVVPDHSFS